MQKGRCEIIKIQAQHPAPTAIGDPCKKWNILLTLLELSPVRQTALHPQSCAGWASTVGLLGGLCMLPMASWGECCSLLVTLPCWGLGRRGLPLMISVGILGESLQELHPYNSQLLDLSGCSWQSKLRLHVIIMLRFYKPVKSMPWMASRSVYKWGTQEAMGSVKTTSNFL